MGAKSEVTAKVIGVEGDIGRKAVGDLATFDRESDVADTAEGGISLGVDKKFEAVNAGETKDSVVGDVRSKSEGDSDGSIGKVGVGCLPTNDSGKKAVLVGVVGGGVEDCAAELDWFEWVSAVKEDEFLNGIGVL
jgi:hypothetical protein